MDVHMQQSLRGSMFPAAQAFVFWLAYFRVPTLHILQAPNRAEP